MGVEPQVQRIGAYKSAGDQLLRRDMSDAQREQLGELLDDIYEDFLTTVAEARGKSREVSCIPASPVVAIFRLMLFSWSAPCSLTSAK